MRLRGKSGLTLLSVAVLAGSSLVIAARAQEPAARIATVAAPFPRLGEIKQQQALIDRYCIGCHSAADPAGGLAFDALSLETAPDKAEVWEKVVRKLRGRMMPPAGNPHPSEAQTNALVSWIEGYLDHAAAKAPDPGHIALHRLNRKEYANAVRDLFALDIAPTALLPQDEVADGFDNVAEALQVSPSFLDQYIVAARTVAVLAVGEAAPRPSSASYAPAPDEGAKQTAHVEGLPLGTRGGMVVEHFFPADGEYEINIADMVLGIYFLGVEFQHKLIVVVDGAKVYETALGGEEDLKAIDQRQSPAVDAINGRLKKIRFKATAGPHKVGVTFVAKTFAESDSRLQPLSPGGGVDRLPRVTGFEVRGPFNTTGLSATPSRRRIFTCYPKQPSEEAACADQILGTIGRRAYRRPLTAEDMAEIRRFYAMGAQRAGFDEGVRSGLTRILASPDFLYRIEDDPDGLPPGGIYALTDLELASRLSFFLWGSIPDDRLLDTAVAGRLKRPQVLEAEVKRMLADPKADALVTSFAFQWLQVAKLDDVTADANLFPTVAKHRDVVGFDGDVRADFKEELRLFVGGVFREDRSVLDLITSNDTYLNERLALHYGVSDVKGDRFRKVTLAQSARRGLLGKGAVLMSTSYPNRTSPVLRGAWILETLLGTPPTPPPPGVEALTETLEGKTPLTVRERMVAHRANPTCHSCHAIMDPLGLALENFDAVGAWRVRDRFAGEPIDASGELPNGTRITGPDDLRSALLARPDQFTQTFTEKLTTYALGRTLEYRDMPAVRGIVDQAEQDNYRFSSIVMAIVESDLFQMRRKPAAEGRIDVAAAGPR